MIFAVGPGAMNAVRLPPEEQPEVTQMLIVGELFMVTRLVKTAGTALPQHSHRYGHISQISAGSVSVFLDGHQKAELRAGDAIEIPANTKHLFVTLEDNTKISCIHHDPTGEGYAEVTDEHQIT